MLYCSLLFGQAGSSLCLALSKASLEMGGAHRLTLDFSTVHEKNSLIGWIGWFLSRLGRYLLQFSSVYLSICLQGSLLCLFFSLVSLLLFLSPSYTSMVCITQCLSLFLSLSLSLSLFLSFCLSRFAFCAHISGLTGAILYSCSHCQPSYESQPGISGSAKQCALALSCPSPWSGHSRSLHLQWPVER